MATETYRTVRIIVAVLGAAVALISTTTFLTSANTQAAPLLGTGTDPEIRLITMTADIPHYDPENNDGINKTVYFSNSVGGVITMTFDISGTQTLTLTASAAFDEQERTYTSTSQMWSQPVTYAVATTHTTQYNVAYTATNANNVTTTVAITYVRDSTAPTNVIITAPASISATQFVVSWAASGAVSYTVAYSRTGDAGWRGWLTNTTATSGTFQATETEIEYIFQVTAHDQVGNSAQATTATWVGPSRIYLPLTLRQWATWYQYDTYEPNNTREEAHGPLNSEQSYDSYIYNENDQRDYYYLTPASSGSIVVDLTVPACCDYDLYLYDSLTGDFIAASNYMGKGLNEQMTYNSAQAGTTYYILVYSPYQDYSDQDQYQLQPTFP